jgi:hypothetical protein
VKDWGIELAKTKYIRHCQIPSVKLNFTKFRLKRVNDNFTEAHFDRAAERSKNDY